VPALAVEVTSGVREGVGVCDGVLVGVFVLRGVFVGRTVGVSVGPGVFVGTWGVAVGSTTRGRCGSLPARLSSK
jgi:hypothetical protein